MTHRRRGFNGQIRAASAHTISMGAGAGPARSSPRHPSPASPVASKGVRVERVGRKAAAEVRRANLDVIHSRDEVCHRVGGSRDGLEPKSFEARAAGVVTGAAGTAAAASAFVVKNEAAIAAGAAVATLAKEADVAALTAVAKNEAAVATVATLAAFTAAAAIAEKQATVAAGPAIAAVAALLRAVGPRHLNDVRTV
jgi:hypothetical protein